jgi:glycosyltransferase involved in cell wall biosynthesis
MPADIDRFQPEAVTHHAPPSPAQLPQRLLYATSAGIGGTGLDSTSMEGALASQRAGFLSRAICYGSQQREIPRSKIKSLQWHPVRALSCLGSEDYYAAKKRYLDLIAARALRQGDYDAFHGWSGDSFRSLVEARLRNIPSVIDIPTWHRNKGIRKRGETQSERAERLTEKTWRDWRKTLSIDRPRMLAEYDLADIILMASRKATETFLAAGVPEKKLCYVARGVDPERYTPGTPPDKFRLIFVGALIKRKGVHHLLAAWKKLNLKDAELILVGTLHHDIKPYMADLATSTVHHLGFSASVQDELRQSTAFVFPSECEGFAKVTLEAAACALPLIATAESGDAVKHQHNGLIIPPNDSDALATAIQHAYHHRDEFAAMGKRGRERVLSCFTWDHYRQRVLQGYAMAQAAK